ncbi:MAG: CoA-binding protein, partial [Desulfobacterales bacterium]|nr:CoA-binding protein [Desulfobacterales bacterium]
MFKSLKASPVILYAVNPRRSEVFGSPCLSSLSELPDREKEEGKADLAILTIPAAAVPAALADCIEAGISQAVVISSGFSEAGPAGRALQAEVEALGDRIHVLGPNCAGFANVSEGIIATRLYSQAASGCISLVSQSGALMMALHGAFAEKGSGLRTVVSVGNQAGFRLSDFMNHFAADPGTKVVAAFIEGMPDGADFVAAARRCLAAGKPVIAVKSGRTELGTRLAATHTAALVGEGRVFEAVCRQYGIILVDDIEDLVAAASLAAATASSPLNYIAWISQSGGLGSLVGDLAKVAGIEPQPFPVELGAALNPLDVGGDRMRGGAIRDTLQPFLSHKGMDAIVLLFAKNPNRDIEFETAKAIIA